MITMKLLVRGGGYTLFFIDLMGGEDLKVEIERYLQEIGKGGGRDYMRYIVEVEELSAEVLEKLNKALEVILCD